MANEPRINAFTQIKNLSSFVAQQYNFVAQSPAVNLTGGTPATVTLSPFPAGITANSAIGGTGYHNLYITGGTSETVLITAVNVGAGTVTFTPANSHTSGAWSIQSATAGIQEAIYAMVEANANGGNVTIPAGTDSIYGMIFIGNGSANNSSGATASTINGITLVGAGSGGGSYAFPGATDLVWAGPSGTPMVKFLGPIYGSSLSNMRLYGGASGTKATKLIEMWGANSATFINLNLQRCAASGICLDMYGTDNATNGGCSGLTFIGCQINAVENGSIALQLGNQTPPHSTTPDVFGCSFLNCSFAHAADVSTSVGVYAHYCDNINFFGCGFKAIGASAFSIFCAQTSYPSTAFPNLTFHHCVVTGGYGGTAGTTGLFTFYEQANSGAFSVTNGIGFGDQGLFFSGTGMTWKFRDPVTFQNTPTVSSSGTATLTITGGGGNPFNFESDGYNLFLYNGSTRLLTIPLINTLAGLFQFNAASTPSYASNAAAKTAFGGATGVLYLNSTSGSLSVTT